MCFEKGILLYQQKRFSEAMAKFTKILAVDKDDKILIKYYGICAEYEKNPSVADDWDGTLEMREK